MLTIRREQMRLLGAPKRELFERWLAQQLSDRFPAHATSLGKEGLAAFVTRAIDQASGYGIRNTASVAGFAGFLLEFGENFENLPDDSDARAILEDRDFPGPLKVELLFECLVKATGGHRLLPVV